MKKMRYLAATTCAMALIGAGASFLLAQSPPGPQSGPPVRPALARLRAEVIRLRTEVEMLRFDYELARDVLLEDLKARKASWLSVLKMDVPSPNMTWFQEELMKLSGGNPPKKSEEDRKTVAELGKLMEQAGKKQEAEEAAFLAEGRKKLATIFAALAEKRLDLEDAERRYNDLVR